MRKILLTASIFVSFLSTVASAEKETYLSSCKRNMFKPDKQTEYQKRFYSTYTHAGMQELGNKYMERYYGLLGGYLNKYRDSLNPELMAKLSVCENRRGPFDGGNTFGDSQEMFLILKSEAKTDKDLEFLKLIDEALCDMEMFGEIDQFHKRGGLSPEEYEIKIQKEKAEQSARYQADLEARLKAEEESKADAEWARKMSKSKFQVILTSVVALIITHRWLYSIADHPSDYDFHASNY